MSQIMSPTTHVIFDFGGTVGDTISVTYHVFQEIAAKNGKTIPESFEMEVSELDSAKQLVDRFLEVTNLDKNKNKEIVKQLIENVFIKTETNGIPMVSGVHKLIKHLSENNIPMSIATNGPNNITQLLLNNTIGLDRNIFSHCVSGGDDPEVKNNKPATDIYLVCVKRFKTSPKSLDSCVIFEYSIRGITGAVNTGMKTVFLNEYKRPKQEFQTIVDKITVIIDSFDNFKPESVGLPPYLG